MRNYIHKVMTMLFVSVAALSCETIHEFPNENPADPTLVNLEVEMNISSEIKEFYDMGLVYSKGGVGSNQSLRVVFEVYKHGNGNVPVVRKVALLNSSDLNVTVTETFKLNAAKYRVVSWVDYVNGSNASDQYYSTLAGLKSITFIEPIVGNTDNKDCFFGRTDIDLTPYRDQWNIKIPLSVALTRPVSKYILITNDVEKFIANQSKDKGTDINSFSAKIYYQGFVPTGFNAYDNKFNDAKTGLWYSTKMERLNDKEAVICFDYPFSNGPGSMVKLGIQIFDAEGVLLNEVGNVVVPITKGELTIIRSDFLTRKYAPGISIDPNYDGEFDFEI